MCLRPADLTDDQKLIGQTAEEFVTKEVLPLVKDLENKKPGLMAELVRKGGEVGLMGGGVPEQYGGAGLDKIAATVLTEKLSIYGGFAVTHGAHAGIGTLPIVYFGTEEQKKKYLPKLATAENDWGLLPVGTASRIGRAKFIDAGSTESRRHTLRAKWPEDVDYERWIRGCLCGLRESRWGEIHSVHRGADIPGIQAGE
jgi:hypothetical protein